MFDLLKLEEAHYDRMCESYWGEYADDEWKIGLEEYLEETAEAEAADEAEEYADYEDFETAEARGKWVHAKYVRLYERKMADEDWRHEKSLSW